MIARCVAGQIIKEKQAKELCGRDKGSSEFFYHFLPRRKRLGGITSPASHDTSITDSTLYPKSGFWLVEHTGERERERTFENSAEIEVIKCCWKKEKDNSSEKKGRAQLDNIRLTMENPSHIQTPSSKDRI